MSVQILDASMANNELKVVVWLDTSKEVYQTQAALDEQGNPVTIRVGPGAPDPEWLLERRYGPANTTGEGAEFAERWHPTHIERCVRAALKDAHEELQRREPAQEIPLTDWKGAQIDRSDLLALSKEGLPETL